MPAVDLRDLTCPMTWVKTKLALERLAPGETLEVRLGNPESLRDVPRSAAEAGHLVQVEGDRVRIVRC